MSEEIETMSNNAKKFIEGDHAKIEGLRTVSERLTCVIGDPVADDIGAFCFKLEGTKAKQLCEHNSIYVIRFSFSVNANSDKLIFVVKLKNSENCEDVDNKTINYKNVNHEIRDKYPKQVSIFRSAKLGINNYNLMFEEISEGKVLVYEYNELHPMIYISAGSTASSYKYELYWCFSDQRLEGERYVHLMVSVPNCVVLRESEYGENRPIFADLILKCKKGNETICEACRMNVNLIEHMDI